MDFTFKLFLLEKYRVPKGTTQTQKNSEKSLSPPKAGRLRPVPTRPWEPLSGWPGPRLREPASYRVLRLKLCPPAGLAPPGHGDPPQGRPCSS